MALRTDRPGWRTVAVALLAAGALACAASAVASASRVPRASAAKPSAHRQPKFRHVFEIVMENLEDSTATSDPAYATLLHRFASATDVYASSHPSLPNYLDLTAGSTFSISSDCETCFVAADNLGAQLSAAHVSWGDYSEGLPHACYLGGSFGLYAAKHVPFRYFDDVRGSARLCAHLHPLGTLLGVLRQRASAVPAFSFVTPNLCHDGHSCAPSVAAAWLTQFLATVRSSAAFKDHGLVIVTWDEGSTGDTSSIEPDGTVLATGGGGHIPSFFVVPGVRPGTLVRQPLSHDALLATVERNFGLPYLRGARAWASHTLSLR